MGVGLSQTLALHHQHDQQAPSFTNASCQQDARAPKIPLKTCFRTPNSEGDQHEMRETVSKQNTGEGYKIMRTCFENTLKMSTKGGTMSQNGTPNQSKPSPGALWDPPGPPRAPTGGPQSSRNGVRDAFWSPRGGQNEPQNQPKMKDQTRLISRRCLDLSWITKMIKMTAFGGACAGGK